MRRVWTGQGANLFGGPSRDGRWLYTVNGLSDDVSVVDLATAGGRRTATYRVGKRPWGVALIY